MDREILNKTNTDTLARKAETPQIFTADLPSNAGVAAKVVANKIDEQSTMPASPIASAGDDKKGTDKRKQRTRKLIDLGGLIVKVGLDPLKSDALYGALLTLKYQFARKTKEEVFQILDNWTQIGAAAFEAEKGKGAGIAIKFKFPPIGNITDKLKDMGFKYSSLRKEWEGRAVNIEALKLELGDADFDIQIL